MRVIVGGVRQAVVHGRARGDGRSSELVRKAAAVEAARTALATVWCAHILTAPLSLCPQIEHEVLDPEKYPAGFRFQAASMVAASAEAASAEAAAASAPAAAEEAADAPPAKRARVSYKG